MLNPRPQQTRAEQIAEAFLLISKTNHYMVGFVDANVTLGELDAAEQILITVENETRPDGAHGRSKRFDRAFEALNATRIELIKRTPSL